MSYRLAFTNLFRCLDFPFWAGLRAGQLTNDRQTNLQRRYAPNLRANFKTTNVAGGGTYTD